MVREYRRVERDVKKLTANPSDSKARLSVGRFEAFIKGDWKSGLTKLSTLSDQGLRLAALGDLHGGDPSVGSVPVAQAWLKLAEDEKSVPHREAMQLRAYHCLQPVYQQTVDASELAMLDGLMALSPRRYLSDLKEAEVIPGIHPFGKYGDSGIGTEIEVDEIKFPYGIGLHPPNKGYAAVIYKLTGRYATFHSGYGFTKHVEGPAKPVTFAVFGDGKLLWRSPPAQARDTILVCQVNVKGVSVLELRTEQSDTAYGSHACWLDPYLAR
jgi:hypothetical protein